MVLLCGNLNKSFDCQQSRESEGLHYPQDIRRQEAARHSLRGGAGEEESVRRRGRYTPRVSALELHSPSALGDTQARAWISLQDSV